jgi:hypothetical protein
VNSRKCNGGVFGEMRHNNHDIFWLFFHIFIRQSNNKKHIFPISTILENIGKQLLDIFLTIAFDGIMGDELIYNISQNDVKIYTCR